MLMLQFLLSRMLLSMMYLAKRSSMEFVNPRWSEKYQSLFITLEETISHYSAREEHAGTFSVLSRLQSKIMMLRHHSELQYIRICVQTEPTGIRFRMGSSQKSDFEQGIF